MIKPKKSLGQNFLKDEEVLERIVEAADLKKDDFIVEIGPGKGALTEKLSQKGAKVLAIELDDRLIHFLNDKFKSEKNIKIIHDDILKINFSKIITDHSSVVVGYKVVANLPYYITSPIIRYFLENKIPPREMVLMVQKEVAERIVAEPGQLSILGVSVQYYAKAQYLFTVSRNSFDPVPQVDSAVIRIIIDNQQNVRNKEEDKKFFQIVKMGFSAKRKTLGNNLANGLHADKKEIENILEKNGFSKTVRAQELSVDDWKKLVKII